MVQTIQSPSANSIVPTSWIGQVIEGRYRVLRVLGEGAMGAVLVAEHVGLGKQVALKVIRPELAADPELQERFQREALASARLAHPSIAGCLDLGELPGGGAFLVMPLVRGRSLEAAIAAGERMAWRDVCTIGAQIADALAAAHAIGVVHRDLKPANVLVERGEGGGPRAVVLDFGVARIRDVAALGLPPRELTRRGAVIGTPGYMAPEQAMGDPADHRCDLYALGVILWECLAGRRLWVGETVTDLFTRQLGDDPPPLAGLGAGPLPAGLEALIHRLIARPIERRPATAREVRDVLLEMTRGAGPKEQVKAAAGSPRRGRAVVLAAAAALLVVALVVVVLGGGGGGGGGGGEAAPGGLADAEAVLAGSAEPGRRKAAAAAILGHRPEEEVPPHLLALARYEAATVCADKSAALKAIADAGDRRALPALEQASRVGVGLCGKELRAALASAISALGGAPAPQARPRRK